MDEIQEQPRAPERSLLDIIAKMVAIAPDLEAPFRHLVTSIHYTAPEMMSGRWHEAAELLGMYADGHTKELEIASIWTGKSVEELQAVKGAASE